MRDLPVQCHFPIMLEPLFVAYPETLTCEGLLTIWAVVRTARTVLSRYTLDPDRVEQHAALKVHFYSGAIQVGACKAKSNDIRDLKMQLYFYHIV